MGLFNVARKPLSLGHFDASEKSFLAEKGSNIPRIVPERQQEPCDLVS
jgi:hypothetical protein